MRGRKPKPTHLKLIDGNPGKRPIEPDLPQAEGELVDPPEWFDDEQRTGWQYAIEHAPKGLLTPLDRAALVAFIVAENEYRKAVLKVVDEGQTTLSPEKGVEMQTASLAIMNKQALIMTKLAAELGFTPSSRGRVTLKGGKGGKENDPLAEFGLGG
jgi:P27 family predicted phage terminase small subunit